MKRSTNESRVTGSNGSDFSLQDAKWRVRIKKLEIRSHIDLRLSPTLVQGPQCSFSFTEGNIPRGCVRIIGVLTSVDVMRVNTYSVREQEVMETCTMKIP